jgi:hypothetical protein
MSSQSSIAPRDVRIALVAPVHLRNAGHNEPLETDVLRLEQREGSWGRVYTEIHSQKRIGIGSILVLRGSGTGDVATFIFVC